MRCLRRPSAVLLDWDMTLYNYLGDAHFAINRTLRHFKQEPLSLDQTRTFLERADAFEILFGTSEKQAMAIDELYIEQIKLQRGCDLLAGARESLDLLRSYEIPMSIVSNKNGATVRQEVKMCDLSDYFTHVIGEGDTRAIKPDTSSLHRALQGLRIESPQDIWMVGDNIVDILSAQRAGFHPILFGNGTAATLLIKSSIQYCHFHDHAEFYEHLETIFANDLPDAPSL